MKSAIFLMALFASVTSQAALYSYSCTTETGKPVVLKYTTSGDPMARYQVTKFKVENLILDGKDYANIAIAGKSDDSFVALNVIADNFRNGERLSMSIDRRNPKNSYYFLGQFQGSLNCKDTTEAMYHGL